MVLARRSLIAGDVNTYWRVDQFVKESWPAQLALAWGPFFGDDEVGRRYKYFCEARGCCLDDGCSKELQQVVNGARYPTYVLPAEQSPRAAAALPEVRTAMTQVEKRSKLGIFDLECGHREVSKGARASSSLGHSRSVVTLSADRILTQMASHHQMRFGHESIFNQHRRTKRRDIVRGNDRGSVIGVGSATTRCRMRGRYPRSQAVLDLVSKKLSKKVSQKKTKTKRSNGYIVFSRHADEDG